MGPTLQTGLPYPSASNAYGYNTYPAKPYMPPNSIALNGPIDIMVPKSTPGTPAGATPPVVIRPRNTAPAHDMFNPTRSIAGVPYASSIPIGPIPKIPEIPPPYLVAPNLYEHHDRPAWAMYPNTPSYPIQNNYYPYYAYGTPYPGYSPYGYPGGYGAPGIGNPMANPGASQLNQARTPQPVPPQQQPQEPPQAQPAPTPAAPPANEGPPVNLNGAKIDNATIMLLNEQLNSPTESTRQTAAMDFYKILEANPELSLPGSAYRPIVEAFMYKILKDPDAVVRQPGMLAFEMDKFYVPTNRILREFQDLARKHGLQGLEPQIARTILTKARLGKFNPPADVSGTGDSMATTMNGSPPGGNGIANVIPGLNQTNDSSNAMTLEDRRRLNRRADAVTGQVLKTNSFAGDVAPKTTPRKLNHTV